MKLISKGKFIPKPLKPSTMAWVCKVVGYMIEREAGGKQ